MTPLRESIVECTLRLNGDEVRTRVRPNTLLVDWLREEKGLRGTRVSCDVASCGVCTVLVDDRPHAACSTFVYEVDGCEVETIEGLSRDGTLHPVQESFLRNFGFQCGFCTPGMIMLVVALLRADPAPTEEQVRAWLGANVCRCTGYMSIVRSVLAVTSDSAANATSVQRTAP